MTDFRQCSVDGCGKVAIARGWCKTHYYRWNRNGDPLAGRVPPGALIEWLENNVGYSGDDCLIWPFARNIWGYGVLSIDGKRTTASRAMCYLAHGVPPSESMEAAHFCGRGGDGCVNPKHLRWATSIENQTDRIGHGTSNRGARNGFSKLSNEEIIAIRDMAGKEPQKEIAKKFGISACHVSKILNGGTWAWLGAGPC